MNLIDKAAASQMCNTHVYYAAIINLQHDSHYTKGL